MGDFSCADIIDLGYLLVINYVCEFLQKKDNEDGLKELGQK